MKTTRSFDFKCMQLTSAINTVARQATGIVACAGFKDTGKYKKSPLTAAQIAAVLNYGSPHINVPDRPFMENAIKGNYSGQLTRITKKHVAHLFRQEIQDLWTYSDMRPARRSKRASKAMADELAAYMYHAIMREIKTGDFKPLAEWYKKARKKEKFLDKSDDFIKLIKAWTMTEKSNGVQESAD